MNDKKIVFIEPPAVKLKIGGVNVGAIRTNHPKISQLTLAAVVENEFDYENYIIDMKSAAPENELKFKEIPYGKDIIEVYKVGQRFEEIEEKIRDSDFVIFTANFTQEAGIIGNLISFCKKINPKIKIFVGGSDAAVKTDYIDRQQYFYSKGADKVSLGDGEIILPKLIREENLFERKLKNFNLSLNPALHLVNLNEYIQDHEGSLPKEITTPLMYLETSRGCRQNCDFCATPFNKGEYRFMNFNRIKNRLKQYKDYGIKTILLIEDNILSRLDFAGGREEIIRWFTYMRENGFAWDFSNGVELGKLTKTDGIDEELVEALFGYNNSVGCYRSYIPLERVDNKKYRKMKSFETQKKILRAIIRQRVPLLNLGVIIGNPEETTASLGITEQRMGNIMDYIIQESDGKTIPYADIFLHIPLPGTKDYKRFDKEKRIIFDINEDPELFNFYTSVVNGNNFSYYDFFRIRKDMALRLNGKAAMVDWEKTGRHY